MEWTIVLNAEHQCIEVVTRGIADKDTSLNMVNAIIHEMQTRQIKKVLIDHRNLENVAGSIMDIYERPQVLKDSGALGVKIALIVKPEHWGHFRFFETVCVNQGFSVSIFHDQKEAIAWLS